MNRIILLTVFLAASMLTPSPQSFAEEGPCPSPDGVYTAAEVDGIDATECDVVGDVVRDEGGGVAVPEPGFSVTLTAIGELPEDSIVLSVQTSADGTIQASTEEDPDVDLDLVNDSGCLQTGYKLNYERWIDTSHWHINLGTIPTSDLNVDTTVLALRRGVQNIINGHSPCQSQGNITANASYEGDTNKTADITRDFKCAERRDTDGVSVVSFGNLPARTVAATCAWGYNRNPESEEFLTLTQADMRFNSADYNFASTNDCDRGEHDVQNIATHEFGHWFGLGHPKPAEGFDQTMHKSAKSCETKKRSLGRGDLLGLNEYY